jgi:hypothetical protein
MSVSRRKFLRSGALVSAALALKPTAFALGKNSPWSSRVAHAPTGAKRGHSYTREMFEPYIGDTFRVRMGRQMVDLKLVALTPANAAATGITTGKNIATNCFSIRFHASKPLPNTERVHQLNHAQLGTFGLFMTQSMNGREFVQTAIVNHVI